MLNCCKWAKVGLKQITQQGVDMASKVEQKMMVCPNEGRPTLHYRNTKQMSWLVHLVLILISGGLWLIIWAMIALYHAFTKPIGGKWHCSQCGLGV